MSNRLIRWLSGTAGLARSAQARAQAFTQSTWQALRTGRASAHSSPRTSQRATVPSSSMAPTRSPQDTTTQPQWLSGEHHHPSAGSRSYRLFVPAGPHQPARPLLLMLHGCTQDPDDFAAGTGMNALAAAHGLLVLYPAQGRSANPQRCWNWFKHHHQQRGRGEAAWLASLVQTVAAEHGTDPARTYVAGLSAGGAMAAILGDAYPDLFAAVGVHSGLATGAADGALAAFAAMRDGGQAPPPPADHRAPPTVIFHGTADDTVHPRNAQQVFSAALVGQASNLLLNDALPGHAQCHPVQRQVAQDAQGRVQAECWLVQGLGHAWSGGSPEGSYTDPLGPSASDEMLRFFFRHGQLQAATRGS